jgi:hypothetical protein
MSIRAATDVGGTYTDLVYYTVDDTGRCGAVRTAKVDTTPPRFEQGVMAALAKGDVPGADLAFFAHGATVVINAITERKGRSSSGTYAGNSTNAAITRVKSNGKSTSRASRPYSGISGMRESRRSQCASCMPTAIRPTNRR